MEEKVNELKATSTDICFSTPRPTGRHSTYAGGHATGYDYYYHVPAGHQYPYPTLNHHHDCHDDDEDDDWRHGQPNRLGRNEKILRRIVV